MEIEIGTEFVLQNCAHKWLNGVTAVITEVRGPGDYVAESEEGRHIIGPKQIGVCFDPEPEDDGQPTMYEEYQDHQGGDDWDHGQYDDYM